MGLIGTHKAIRLYGILQVLQYGRRACGRDPFIICEGSLRIRAIHDSKNE